MRASIDVEHPGRPLNVTCCEVKKQSSHRIRDNWRIRTDEIEFDMNSYGKKRCKSGLSFNRKHFILMEIGSLSTFELDVLKAWQLVEKSSTNILSEVTKII
jgi:hypothetical protein